MLHSKIDQLILELKEREIVHQNQTDVKAFAKYCNTLHMMVTLHDISNYRPLFINDPCRDFYGFKNNFLKGMDYLYYLKTIHPSYYPTLFRSLTFFNENKEEYLDLTYKLKAADGKWRTMVGTTKTVTRSAENRPLHAISVLFDEEEIGSYTQQPIQLLESLTKRELEIFMALTEGQSAMQISEQLFIAEETVKKHKKNIFKKLGCKKTNELISLSYELGIKF